MADKSSLQNELRDTSGAALKNFRICLIVLGLLASSLSLLSTDTIEVSQIVGYETFKLGIGLIVASMMTSIFVLTNRWLETSFLPRSRNKEEDVLRHNKSVTELESERKIEQDREKLKQNRGLLVGGHFMLFCSVLMIAPTFLVSLNPVNKLITSIILATPLLSVIILNRKGFFTKIGEMEP
ncbi:hypothetical protein [Candidatus Nanohalococcus occultus]|uniref:hypothetical protein n=1 Tax=Candidatus Nanohalococcus occultus TaxID=2978047 RepID=UPI0039E16BBA